MTYYFTHNYLKNIIHNMKKHHIDLHINVTRTLSEWHIILHIIIQKNIFPNICEKTYMISSEWHFILHIIILKNIFPNICEKKQDIHITRTLSEWRIILPIKVNGMHIT